MEALLVSFSQEPFSSLKQMGFFSPEKKLSYYRFKKYFKQKASSREGTEARLKPVVVEWAVTCFTNLSEEIA